MPLHQDLHIDRPLTNYAVEYKNGAFIASQVAPFVPVNNKSDDFVVFTKADKFSLPNDLRGPKDEAKETTWGTGSETYACKDRALKDFISDAMAANADVNINPNERTTGFLVDLLLLGFEKRVRDLAFTYANYATSGLRVTLAGDDQFSSSATSDPIGVIDTAVNACFMPANTLIMGKAVYDVLKRHPQLLDHVKGGSTSQNAAKVNLQNMAEIFEVDRILVGQAKYNTSRKGQTAAYSYLWDDSVVAAYIDPSVTLDNLTAWKTFRWNQESTGAGYKVRRYRDEKRGGGGNVIEAEMSIDEKAICADLAYIVYDCLA
jgi:hypothetical protein